MHMRSDRDFQTYSEAVTLVPTRTYIIDKCSCPIYNIGKCETSSAKLTSFNLICIGDIGESSLIFASA